MFLLKNKFVYTLAGLLIISGAIYLWHLYSRPHIVEVLGHEYIYKGDMKNGKANGSGLLFEIEEYPMEIGSGVFKDDKLNGFGRIQLHYGQPGYTGQFINGIPNGTGTIWDLAKFDIYSNHLCGIKNPIDEFSTIAYQGEIKNGRPNGKGTLYLNIGGIGDIRGYDYNTVSTYFKYETYEGIFSDGAYVGEDSSINDVLALYKPKSEPVRSRSLPQRFGSTDWPSDQDMRNDAQDGSYSYEEAYGGGVEDDQTHHVDPHWVDEYERSDGTEVDGYWRGGDDGYMRSDPDEYEWNNLNP